MVRVRLLLVIGLLVSGHRDGPDDPAGIEAITRPSQDVTLSFVRAGQIAEVRVKDGDAVRPGDLLAHQDDAAEQAALQQQQAQADDETRIKAAEAQLAQRKVDLKRLEEATGRGAATEFEVEHARLDVTIAELSLVLAEFQQTQDRRKGQEMKIQLERMRLASPIAGRVEKVLLQAGESADALEDVIRVVRTDPLRVDVPVPLGQARGLKVGMSADVVFPEQPAPTKARIIHVAAVADAASDTLTVRVEVPNPAGRPAGEHVRVRFSPILAAESPTTRPAPATRSADQKE